MSFLVRSWILFTNLFRRPIFGPGEQKINITTEEVHMETQVETKKAFVFKTAFGECDYYTHVVIANNERDAKAQLWDYITGNEPVMSILRRNHEGDDPFETLEEIIDLAEVEELDLLTEGVAYEEFTGE